MQDAVRWLAALAIALASAHAAPLAADNPQQVFAKSWEGKTVVIKRTLYTLVYNERGRLGSTHKDRRDGLVVVTPFSGWYFQFDGRQSQDDLTDKDPQHLVDAVAEAYRSDPLDVRQYQKIEPVLLARYEVGGELVVAAVRIERDTVRLLFADPRTQDNAGEPATSLTVKWPTPLSRSMAERDAVEGLITQFVQIRNAR